MKKAILFGVGTALLLTIQPAEASDISQEARWFNLIAEIRSAGKYLGELNLQGNSGFDVSPRQRAFAAAREAIDTADKAFGQSHPYKGTALWILATLYARTGDYAQAEVFFEQASPFFESSKNTQRLAELLDNLGATYYANKKFDKAIPVLEHSLAIREESLGKDHPDISNGLTYLQMSYKAIQDDKKAQAIQVRREEISRNHPAESTWMNTDLLVGFPYFEEEDSRRESNYMTSLHDAEASARKDGLPVVAEALDVLAAFHAYREEAADAGPYYQRAVEVREDALGPEHVEVAEALARFANFLSFQKSIGEWEEAEPLYERAIAILETNPDSNAELLKDTKEMYAAMLLQWTGSPEPRAQRKPKS